MVSEIQANTSVAAPAATQATPMVSLGNVQTAPNIAPAQPAARPEVKVDLQKLHQDLTSSLEMINQAMRDGGRNLSFNIDHSVQGPVVMVQNTDTGEVIRQIPNEAVVRVAHNIDALKGVLYNGLS